MNKKLAAAATLAIPAGVAACFVYGWWRDVYDDFWHADLSHTGYRSALLCKCLRFIDEDCPVHGDDPDFGGLIVSD